MRSSSKVEQDASESVDGLQTDISYKVLRRKLIGRGAYGVVYEAKCGFDSKMKYVVKVDTRSAQRKSGMSALEREFRLYSRLYGHPGFARVFAFRKVRTKRRMEHHMLMERLGHSVSYWMRRLVDGRLNVWDVADIAQQTLASLMKLHNVGFVHCDVKPSNILFGNTPETRTRVYLIDLGLVKTIVPAKRTDRASRFIRGTPQYVSINNHYGVRNQRRDDLETLAYVLIHMARGSLPWRNMVEHKQGPRYTGVCKQKETVNINELTNDMPDVFRQLLRYARRLGPNDVPDYQQFIAHFTKLAAQRPSNVPMFYFLPTMDAQDA